MSRENAPKYLQVINWIREKIAGGDFNLNDRLPSESEIGALLSVSRQTVRQATSVLETDGILERRRGSGTYVISTQVTAREKSMSVGVITTYLDDYIFPSIIQGIDKVLQENGYAMQLAITYNRVENERRILQGMLEKNVDGFIIEPTKSGLPNLNGDLYQKIVAADLPCLFINGYYPQFPFPFIGMDDQACGRAAAEYLMDLGHRKIAGVFKADDIQGHLRYAGCMEALRGQGVALAEENVVWFTTEDFKPESRESFAQRVCARTVGCSAVICYNDQVALRVLELLAAVGRKIPVDLSLISFDNSDLCATSPVGLTTFSHPKEILGNTAARHLIHLMRREDSDVAMRFLPELVIRDSVKDLRVNAQTETRRF